ncbi:MAG: hypothetical protein JSS66_13765 [Armatimonadetes bacterium]|nr:hypothetical protein [Armatimonadota bacterium]
MKARCAASAVLLTLAALAFSQDTGLGKWFDDQIARRIEISGWRRLAYHTRTVSGDLDSYDATEYGGRGLSRYTDFGQVRITGSKVLGVANFDLNIQDSRFQDPQANRFSIDVDKGGWQVNLGDIRGSLGSSNSFARFEKSLTGGQVGYRHKGFQAKAVYSEVRGQPRTVSIQGNNSAGPYYLQSSQILRGSEQVLLDGVEQSFGDDYTMNYELGSITFINRLTFEGRIIPPTSTIVVTYEVLGFNGTKGRVEGANVSYDFGKAGRVGLTSIRQVQGVSSRDSTYYDDFLGFLKAPSTVALQYVPQNTLTVKVYLEGRLLVQGVHYFFDPNLPSLLHLNIDVPSGKVLRVYYTPKAVNTVQGDRSVMGVDYRLPLGSRGAINYSQSVGRLTNTSTPSSGTARGLQLNYRTGPAEISASVRDVPSGFVSIETTGFSRNERSHDVALTMRPSERFNYGLTERNQSVVTFDASNNTVSNRFTSVSAFARFEPKKSGLPWNLSQTRTDAESAGNKSTIDTTTLGTSGHSGRSNWKLDLSNQFANGLVTVDNDREKRNLAIQTLGYHLNYQASQALAFDWNSSLSRVSTAGKNSIGRDLLLGATYRPSDRWSFRTELADSDAGQLATLGFIGGYGLGYDGNGFSSGTEGTTAFSASNARTASFTAAFTPSDRLSLGAGVNYYRSQGGISSNSETLGFGVNGNWKFDQFSDLDLSLDMSNSRFLDSPVTSSATTMSLYVTSNPKGRLSFRGGFNVLITGGNSEFSQNVLGYEANLNYRLAPRHNLMLSVDNGNLTGYQPQETRNFGVTYQYQIWRSLALNIGYKMIDVTNRTPNITSGAYNSRGFDIELEFNFGR